MLSRLGSLVGQGEEPSQGSTHADQSPPRDSGNQNPSSYDLLMAAALAASTSVPGQHTVPCPPLPEDDSFGGYGPSSCSHIRPSLAWDLTSKEVLSALEGDFVKSGKFHASSANEKSPFASHGSLLTPWSDQFPGTIAAHLSQVSPFIANFANKQEPTIIKAIECY